MYDFGTAKTPSATVSALLGDFIRQGDSRVKRIKQKNGSYSYYLTQHEKDISIDILSGNNAPVSSKKGTHKSEFEERDLHILLSTYLKNINIYSKTIFHEQSSHSIDNNQKWTHPDMIGVQFLALRNKTSQNLLKTVNRNNSFNLYSYEIKKEITSDSDLKKKFFQAFSNSSWANYGYLVALEFNGSIYDEMARLNEAFGIGIIELQANPFQSKILFPAKYHELDFKTIDKLCCYNKDFELFISQTEKLLTAEERYYNATEKELEEFADKYLRDDTEIARYCHEKHIPGIQLEEALES